MQEAQEAVPLTAAERFRQTIQKKKQAREFRIQKMRDGLAKKKQLAKGKSSADANEQSVQKQQNTERGDAAMFEMMKRMEKANEDQRAEFKSHVKNLEASVEKMKNEMTIMRNKISNSLPEDPTASKKKKYLLKLKQQASLLESPEMDEIVKRIDTLLEKCSDNDESPLPTNLLVGNFIIQLAVLGN